jgi:uncharacterized membrane protein YdbT with pleckstrin-like domain
MKPNNKAKNQKGSVMNGVVDLRVFRPGAETGQEAAGHIEVKPSQAYYLGYYVRVVGKVVLWIALYLWLNSLWHVSLVVLCVPLGVQALFTGFKAWSLACVSYRLESERVIWRCGVFSRETGSIELFRVQNVAMSQTFFQRLGGVGVVTLVTQDPTNPFLHLMGMRRPEELRDRVNEYVMHQRRARGFREVFVN